MYALTACRRSLRRPLLILGLALALLGGLVVMLGDRTARPASAAQSGSVGDVVFAVHGGAGNITRQNTPPELEASIMDGRTLGTGAVTGVEHIKNPIMLADKVRTTSRHVFFAGLGAELFAIDRGFDLVTQDYFFTDRRWQSLLNAKGGKSEFNFG